MAKKRRRAGKKRAPKKRATKKRRTKVSLAQKRSNIAKRAALLKHATALADFHGGKSPVRSGCGRPRKRR